MSGIGRLEHAHSASVGSIASLGLNPQPGSPLRQHRASASFSMEAPSFPVDRTRYLHSRARGKAPFEGLAKMYGAHGELRDYGKNAQVGRTSNSLEWAEKAGQLPGQPNRILEVGAAQGQGAVWLAQRYETASITALDTDPESTRFIADRISSGKGLSGPNEISNPARVKAFNGTLADALGTGAVHKESVDLINMDAVAPYIDAEELEQMLEQMHAALTLQGKLILSAYGEKHYYNAQTGKPNIQLYTDLSLISMLRNAGFDIECVANTLQNDQHFFEKTAKGVYDLERGVGAMPRHDENASYWHTVKIAAAKRGE